MKSFLFTLGFLLFFNYSGDLTGLSPLDQLQKVYQTLRSWQADFDQETHVDLLGKKIEKAGRIAIQKPGKLRLEYNDADGKVYVSDGKKMTVYQKGANQVIYKEKLKKILAAEALTFLAGVGEVEKEFRVGPHTASKDPKITITDGALKKLDLYPKDDQSILLKIVLGIHPKTHLIHEMILFNTSGNETHYVFRNIRTNRAMDESLFKVPLFLHQ